MILEGIAPMMIIHLILMDLTLEIFLLIYLVVCSMALVGLICTPQINLVNSIILRIIK